MKSIFVFLLIALTIGCKFNRSTPLPKDFDYGVTSIGSYRNDFFNLTVDFDTTWYVEESESFKKMVSDLAPDGFNNQLLKSKIKSKKIGSAYLLSLFKEKPLHTFESNPSLILVIM